MRMILVLIIGLIIRPLQEPPTTWIDPSGTYFYVKTPELTAKYITITKQGDQIVILETIYIGYGQIGGNKMRVLWYEIAQPHTIPCYEAIFHIYQDKLIGEYWFKGIGFSNDHSRTKINYYKQEQKWSR